MRNFFIYYQDNAPINYKHLLKLYAIAENNKNNGLHDIINYNSLEELTNRINNICGNGSISKSTLTNFLNDKGKVKHQYKYFKYYKQQKKIILDIDFGKYSGRKRSFVILNQQEFDYLVQRKSELEIRYFLYIKYYCGKSGKGKTDFTAKQFLQACNLDRNSGVNIGRVSECNSSLLEAHLIEIKRFQDNNGHLRNEYSIP